MQSQDCLLVALGKLVGSWNLTSGKVTARGLAVRVGSWRQPQAGVAAAVAYTDARRRRVRSALPWILTWVLEADGGKEWRRSS